MAGKIYVATEDFVADLDGVPIEVHKGRTRVREGHALLKGREELFAPITVDFEVERATAAPGEKRGRRVADTKE